MAGQLRDADDVHAEHMRDLNYRREYERTRLASDVAIRVVRYRAEHGLTQAQLARQLGWPQPNVARLEAGDHEPTLRTLTRLATVLGIDLSIDITPGHTELRAG